jgi:adenylate cyclase
MAESESDRELAQDAGAPNPALGDDDPEGNERWRAVLNGDYDANPALRGLRPVFRHLPSDPRCKLCSAPYGPPFGGIVKLLGFGPWAKNPSLCGACLRVMERHLGGADVELTMLFADLRGSTELGERMTSAAYRSLVNSYYGIAARVIRETGGVVSKYLGDGVFALFVPGFSGPDHAQRGIEAGRQMLRDTDVSSDLPAEGRPLPLGIGIHTGSAYVGVVGKAGDLLEFTALGDAVNITARLSSAAASRELVISDTALRAAGQQTDGLERRELSLKGIVRPVLAWSERDLAEGAAPPVEEIRGP